MALYSGALGSPEVASLVVALTIWQIAWKGFGLWKSAGKKNVIWFITFLIFNTAGILPISYLFIYNKIKDYKGFKKVQDRALIISLVGLVLAAGIFSTYNILAIIFGALGLLALLFFSVSMIQESFTRKETHLHKVLVVVFTPIGPLIYYFAKVRKKRRKF